MLRVAKPEGFGNIVLEEVPMPVRDRRQVLVQNRVSLISRGSEIGSIWNARIYFVAPEPFQAQQQLRIQDRQFFVDLCALSAYCPKYIAA